MLGKSNLKKLAVGMWSFHFRMATVKWHLVCLGIWIFWISGVGDGWRNPPKLQDGNRKTPGNIWKLQEGDCYGLEILYQFIQFSAVGIQFWGCKSVAPLWFLFSISYCRWDPPTQTNMSPEKYWLEADPFLLKWPLFRGHLLFFGGCIFNHKRWLSSRNIVVES